MISISGHTRTASRSTSVAQASRPTRRSSRPSTGASRVECLNAHWFLSLAAAQEKMEDWCRYYSEERPQWGDRAKSPDDAARLKQCRRPAFVTDAENSPLRWSKVQCQSSTMGTYGVPATENRRNIDAARQILISGSWQRRGQSITRSETPADCRRHQPLLALRLYRLEN